MIKKRLTKPYRAKDGRAISEIPIFNKKDGVNNDNIYAMVNKLADYEDLEHELGISFEDIVKAFKKRSLEEDGEEYKTGRLLTNADALEWDKYQELKQIILHNMKLVEVKTETK